MATKAIRIIKGTFGYWDGGKVVPKTAKDEPFPVETGRAAELVEQGIAEYATATVEINTEEDGEDAQIDAEEMAEDAIDDDAVNLDEMSLDELKKFAETYGVKYKVGMKKADFIEAIRAAELEADELDEADDDGEDAPTFNAEDAVQ